MATKRIEEEDEPVEETVVLAFIGAAPEIRVDWTPKAEGALGLEALATVESQQQVTIDEGVVLTLGEARNILDGLDSLFDGLESAVGGIDRIVGFDCVLNKIEAEQRQLTREVSRMFVEHRVTGFNTYGEQFHALHVNQTFSGLAIGWGR